MRIGLTIIAVFLILTLTAALVGPYFVDWSAQRVAVTAQLSKLVGERVDVRGPIELRLLPSPYVTLRQVEIGDGKGGVLFACDDMRLELGLTALVRGQYRFTQASFVRPTLSLNQGSDGAILLPKLQLAAHPDAIALDNVSVYDGRVRIARADGSNVAGAGGISLSAEAGSLRGPFRGAGGLAMADGRKLSFHFLTGALDGQSLPIKAAVEAGAGQPHGEFDGAIAFGALNSNSGLGATGYSGGAVVSGSIGGAGAALAWRASGALKADLRRATLDNLQMRLGPEDRGLAAEGLAQAEFGASPRLNLSLNAKQLNLDALLREDGKDSSSPAQALGALSAALTELGAGARSPLALALRLDTPAAILGGDTIADVSLSVSAEREAPLVARLEASPPGRSHVLASGAIDLAPAPGFKGKIDVRIGDAQRLRDWLALDAPVLQARLAAISEALPYRSASATGDVDFSGAGFVAKNLNLVLERSTFTGTVSQTRALGAERGRVFADLQTNSLDVDSLPNLAAGAFPDDTDLSFTLDARAIHVARLGEGELDGGSLTLKIIKQGDETRLDHLSIADLGGASLEASGAIDAKGRRLSARIDAARLHDFALLIRRIAPGRASEILVDRSEALSPARLTLLAESSHPTGGDRLADSVSLQGTAATTRVNGRLERSADGADRLSASISLDSPEAAPLLKQIGLPVLSLSGQGRGHVSASAQGRWAEGLDADIASTFAGADLTWRGRLSPQAPADGAPLAAGTAAAKSANIAPLLTMLGMVSPNAAVVVPVDFSGGVVADGEKITFSRLKGSVGRANLLGDLTYRPTPPGALQTVAADPDVALAQSIAGEAPASPATQLEGSLSIDRLPLSAIAGLALGAPQSVKAGALWSDAKFTPALANPPAADIALKVGALDIADALIGREFAARLKLGHGLVGLDEMAMNVAGGGLTGRATLRREGANASISGQISLTPVAIERAGFSGRISGVVDFAGSGQSANALVSGLAGAGQIHLTSAQIPRLDPGALGRIVDKAQAPDYAIDQTNINHALDLEFNKQPLRLPDSSSSVSTIAGVMHFGPFQAQDAKGDATLQASFNLRTFGLEIFAAFAQSGSPKYWTGAPPSVSVALKGPVEALAREIDSSLLSAGLAAAALARETERIAALESDIRERAFFNRRLKAGQFMRRRELELELYAAEQARLKTEADRKRDAEMSKAEEERRKAAPQPAEPLPPGSIPIPDDPQQSATGAAPQGLQPPTPKPRPPSASQRPDPTANGIY